jgi:hypothetical protein
MNPTVVMRRLDSGITIYDARGVISGAGVDIHREIIAPDALLTFYSRRFG